MNDINEYQTESCINCSVTNCVHHTQNGSCNAGKINVGNCTASCCSETCCDTFKSKF